MARGELFGEVATTSNVSRKGFYFLTERERYKEGMRLVLTLPYHSPRERSDHVYLAQVVAGRVAQQRPAGSWLVSNFFAQKPDEMAQKIVEKMPWVRFILACCLLFWSAAPLNAGAESGTLIGVVSFRGTPPKKAAFDPAKEPACVKMHEKDPLTDETIVTGGGKGLANVVVYISAGEADNTMLPADPVLFDQQGCHYKTHVLAARVGQEIKISNSDPISHNVHPLAKVNREWARMQPPGTPAFTYSYDKEEFIPVKCNLHPWMQAYFVVLKTSHFAVTGESGIFQLRNLPPGKYTVTAWHESLGTQSQQVMVIGGESTSIYFVFSAQP